MIVKIYMLAVILADAVFIVLLGHTAIRNRRQMFSEPGRIGLLAVYSFVLQFLAAFGVSDFSVSMIVYKKFHLVDDRKIPGTLMNSCVVPVGVMAVGYLTVIRVEVPTLIICVLCGLAGAMAGTFFVSKMKTETIRNLMLVALSVAAITTLIKQLGLVPPGGSSLGFSGWKLVVVAVFTFAMSALSMGGFASTAILLSFFCLLGLNPVAAFPLAMGTSSLSCAVGGIRYVKKGRFGIKLAVLSTVFGSLGAVVAVCFVKEMDVKIIQWLILAVILYSIIVPPFSVSVILRGAKLLMAAPFSFAAEGRIPWNRTNALLKLSGES